MAGGQHIETTDSQSPAGVKLFVPALLEGLESGDPETARQSGCGLCLLVRTQPGTAPEVVGELVERLAANPVEGPVLRTLATLVGNYDSEIRTALLDAVDREDAKLLYRHIRAGDGWNLAAVLAEDDAENSPAENADADQAASGTDDTVDEQRRVVETDETDAETTDESGESGTRHIETDTGGAVDEYEPDPDAGAARTESRSRDVRLRHARIQQVANSEAFELISIESRFDELQVVEPKSDRRYGTVVRTHAIGDDDEYGVAIRLCPENDSEQYESTLATQFRNWRSVHSHGVVTAVDWGLTPRPWVATEYIEETLADRGQLSPEAALSHAHTLTAGLTELHQYDVVHGGIDPRNVVYATDVLGERDQPMLDNVGLMTVYRQCFDPSSYLDPRYAAPEYFDSRYGSLDHTTDLYQLGMVIYRICTGSAPFEGDFDAVRRQVQKEQPPAPSSVVSGLPEALDEILAKATAKQKLTRYETAAQFHQDIDRLCTSLLE